MRFPLLTRAWELIEVRPDDDPMADFTAGVVRSPDGEGQLNVKRGALWRRRIWELRFGWKLVELRGWDDETGDWKERGYWRAG